jgi:hypothetical protein
MEASECILSELKVLPKLRLECLRLYVQEQNPLPRRPTTTLVHCDFHKQQVVAKDCTPGYSAVCGHCSFLDVIPRPDYL